MKKESATFLFILFLLIFVDQLSKYLIRFYGGFYICNNNLAFDLPPKILIYFIILVLALIWVFKSKCKNQNAKLQFKIKNLISPNFAGKQTKFLAVFILSGTLSNIIDRINYGCVIDFIDLKFWPVFNLADIFITLGAILFAYSFFKNKPREKKNNLGS